MAANGRGHMRPNSGGKSPPFMVIGLLVVIAILAFNYWSLSSKNNALSMDVDEVGMKYRSTQAKKLDVEKRNAELSSLLAESQKYRLEATEKGKKLEDASQKENELNAKIDNLAGEIEVLRNEQNSCDDAVGFCHENITKMIITHKKKLDEIQRECDHKVDESKSNAEQHAAAIEKPDIQQQKLDEQRQQEQQQGQQQAQQQQQQQQQIQDQLSQQQQQPPQQQQLPQQPDPAVQMQQQAEPVLMQGLVQSNDLAQAAQHGYNREPQSLDQHSQNLHNAPEQPALQEQQLPQYVQSRDEPAIALIAPVAQQGLEQREAQHELPQIQPAVNREDSVVITDQHSNVGSRGVDAIQEPVVNSIEQDHGGLYHVEDDQMAIQHIDNEDRAPDGHVVQRTDTGDAAPAGHAIIQNNQDNLPDDTRDDTQANDLRREDVYNARPKGTNLGHDQDDDQAVYISRDKDQQAPVGQPVGDSVLTEQEPLSPLSLQALSEHYQLPARLDTNLQVDLARAEQQLKSQLAFSEESPKLGSLKEVIMGAVVQSSSLRKLPVENLSLHDDKIDVLSNLSDNLHDLPALPTNTALLDTAQYDKPASLSNNELFDNSINNVFDKGVLSDDATHDQEFDKYKTDESHGYKSPDQYDKAVNNILSKENEMELPEIDSPYLRGDENLPTSLVDESGFISGELGQSSNLSDVQPADPKKKLSHGFLFLNITHLLKASELELESHGDDMNSENAMNSDSNLDNSLEIHKTTTSSKLETTTGLGYTTHPSDWAPTTDATSHFDTIAEPHDSFGSVLHNSFEDQESQQHETFDFAQQLAFGQLGSSLPKAMDAAPKQTLEDQLRLPVQVPYRQDEGDGDAVGDADLNFQELNDDRKDGEIGQDEHMIERMREQQLKNERY